MFILIIIFCLVLLFLLNIKFSNSNNSSNSYNSYNSNHSNNLKDKLNEELIKIENKNKMLNEKMLEYIKIIEDYKLKLEHMDKENLQQTNLYTYENINYIISSYIDIKNKINNKIIEIKNESNIENKIKLHLSLSLLYNEFNEINNTYYILLQKYNQKLVNEKQDKMLKLQKIEYDNNLYNKSIEELIEIENNNKTLKDKMIEEAKKTEEYHDKMIKLYKEQIDKENLEKKNLVEINNIKLAYNSFIDIQKLISNKIIEINNESDIENKKKLYSTLSILYIQFNNINNEYNKLLQKYNKRLKDIEIYNALKEQQKKDSIKKQNDLDEEEKKHAILLGGQCLLGYRQGCINNGEIWESKAKHKLCLYNPQAYSNPPKFNSNILALTNNSGMLAESRKWQLVNLDNLCMKTDGNLVALKKDGTIIWQTNTSNNPNAYLRINPDGTLSLYNSDKKLLKKIWPVQ